MTTKKQELKDWLFKQDTEGMSEAEIEFWAQDKALRAQAKANPDTSYVADFNMDYDPNNSDLGAWGEHLRKAGLKEEERLPDGSKKEVERIR